MEVSDGFARANASLANANCGGKGMGDRELEDFFGEVQ
jgi:hypothetical protein